ANALWMDIYGDVTQGQVMFANGDSSWKSSISELAGARYIQVRLSFENNIDSGLSPTLDAMVIAFER
ncbi:MAG: hypothetical protein ACI82F_004463, partial [Planctomycetota bacterium]